MGMTACIQLLANSIERAYATALSSEASRNATCDPEPTLKCSSTDMSATDKSLGGSLVNWRNEICRPIPSPGHVAGSNSFHSTGPARLNMCGGGKVVGPGCQTGSLLRRPSFAFQAGPSAPTYGLFLKLHLIPLRSSWGGREAPWSGAA